MRTLVIGYGNPLRGDDAAGPFVAEQLQRSVTRSDVTVLACHQLTPELSQPISEVDLVIFVDALPGADDDAPTRRVIDADDAYERWSTHRAEPAALVQMAGTLYGHRPRAMLFGIPAKQFEVDAPLSADVRRSCETVIRTIGLIIDKADAPPGEAPHA
jgi:hydrogenase maturation protease